MEYFKRFFFEYRSQIITGISVIIFAIGVLNIYLVTNVNTLSNDECLWRVDKTVDGTFGIIFSDVKPRGVTANAGIKNGDIFVALDDSLISDPYSAQRILNKHKKGEHAKYTYIRDGIKYHTRVYIKKIVFPNNLVNMILALIWFMIGYIVVMAKPGGKEHQLFYLTSLATVFLATRTSFQPPDLMINPFTYFPFPYYQLWLIVGSFFPSAIIHFFLLFPLKSGLSNKKFTVPILYSFSLLIFIVCLYSKEIMTFLAVAKQLNLAEIIIQLYIYFAFVFGFVSLIICFFKAKSKKLRAPIAIIVGSYIATGLALGYLIFILPKMGKLFYNDPEYFYPIFVILLIPISFGVAIFKYHLLDVRQIIRNTVTYGTVTITLGIAYLLSVYLLGQTIGQAFGEEYKNIAAVVIFVLFALVFQSVKDNFQAVLIKRFFPEHYFREKKLIDFTKELANVVGLENILDSIKNTFATDIKIKVFAIYVRSTQNTFDLVRFSGIEEMDSKLSTPAGLIDYYISDGLFSLRKLSIAREEFSEAFPADENRFIAEDIYTIIPLIAKTKIIGLMTFGLKLSGARFEGKDLDLLNTVATQVAISLENARLYKEEAEKLQYFRDLDLARNIQQSLLPKVFPSANGMEIYGKMIPALLIGGDYFDVIPLNDTITYIVIGDVSGKGLPAALYMTKLQTMIQLFCRSGRSTKQIICELNERLYETLARNFFVTLTLARIDKEACEITFCRAGHMPTLVMEKGEISTYTNKGLALGLDKGKIFAATIYEEKLKINKGQLFFFFSDGVNETMNENKEFYGIERIKEILKENGNESPNTIFNSLWSSLNTFKGPVDQFDDVTAVVLKINN